MSFNIVMKNLPLGIFFFTVDNNPKETYLNELI